jgi:hypothetical protein
MAFGIKDAALSKSKALPAAAGSVYTDTLDLETGSHGQVLAECELHVSAPALNTTQLPDTKTMTYSVEHDTDPAFGTVATLFPTVIVQTGAGGAGAAASDVRLRVPLDVKRYVRVKALGGAAIGDCSGASVTAELLF